MSEVTSKDLERIDKTLDKILDKLNKEVIPRQSSLATDLEVVRTQLHEASKIKIKEDSIVSSTLQRHDNLLRGNNSNPGLCSEVQDMKKWVETRIWFERAIIAAILIDIALRLWPILA